MPYFVYVIQDIQTGHIKIGHTVQPKRRLETLRKEYAGTLIYRYLFQIDKRAAQTSLEAYLHRLYEPYRIMEEWFSVSPETVAWEILMDEWADHHVVRIHKRDGFGPVERALLRFDD